MTSLQQRRWHFFRQASGFKQATASEQPAGLELAIGRRLAAEAEHAIRQRGQFHLVLAGGGTPMALYRSLVELETDWGCWSIYFSDERCLPLGDADRNDTMARQCWLDRVPIPPDRIFAIPAELGAEMGAAQYSDTLRSLQRFDLVLLGLGEDGHTASLFPGLASPAPDDPPALPVDAAPKPPPQRITLSAARLGLARQVWFMVSGAGKLDALQRWQRGENIPASWIRPAGGVDIYTDCDADTLGDSTGDRAQASVGKSI